MSLRVMQLKGDAANAEERRIIERQVTHLSRLVDDLLDVSRITQGKVELRREPVDLRAVIVKALELTLPMYERRTRALELELTDAPCVVAGDEVRLAQVVSNLLINAAKFTPDPGAVRLRLSCGDGRRRSRWPTRASASSRSPAARLRPVRAGRAADRPAHRRARARPRDRQDARAHARRQRRGGKRGGGRGSTFTVRLPFVATDRAPAPAPCDRRCCPPEPGRVLVVDDNRDAADTLALVLEAFGYEVRTRTTPPRASMRWARSRRRRDPRHRPARHGRLRPRQKVRRSVRAARGRGCSRSPGYGTQQDRERALRAGFDEHLVKPVDPERLVDALDRALARGR
jgi:CheY-like chemotaxis protein